MGHKYNSNQTHQRRAKYKKAFTQVLEHYETVQLRSLVSIVDTTKTEGFGGTQNAAKPTPTDFKCDVENTIKKVIQTKELLQKFYDVFIMETDDFDEKQKNYYEQRVGKLFISKGIWPVKRYFTSTRG